MVEIKENNDLEDRYLQICLDIIALLTKKAPKNTISIKEIRERLNNTRNLIENKNPYRDLA